MYRKRAMCIVLLTHLRQTSWCGLALQSMTWSGLRVGSTLYMLSLRATQPSNAAWWSWV